jgi:bifunctional polynucleotide phosphatase/kinase
MLFLNQEPDKNDKLNITYPDLSLIPFSQPLNPQYLFRPVLENKRELILMVGFPGSGKTYFAKKFIESFGYIYISQDVLKTKAKCIKEFKNNLILNKNIVIDNLNYSKAIRQEYISIAKENNYDIRCIVLNTSKELSKHNMMCRFYTSNGVISRIPELVYNNYHKKYEIPEMNEGIHKIDFIDYSKIADIKSKTYYEYYY